MVEAVGIEPVRPISLKTGFKRRLASLFGHFLSTADTCSFDRMMCRERTNRIYGGLLPAPFLSIRPRNLQRSWLRLVATPRARS